MHNYLCYRETPGREKRAHRQERVPVCILRFTYLGGIVNIPEVAADENIFMTQTGTDWVFTGKIHSEPLGPVG